MYLLSNSTQLSGLSDCGCHRGEGLGDWPTEWFWKQLVRHEYDIVVIQVHQAVEWNHYGWSLFPPGKCAGSDIPGLVVCFPVDTTEKILNAYMSLVKKKAIIEYDERPLSPKYTAAPTPHLPSSWWSTGTKFASFQAALNHCIATTAKASGSSFELVQWHLQAFYELSRTGKIASGFLYLWPLTAQKYAADRKLPPDVDALENTASALANAVGDVVGGVTGAIGETVTWIKWVLPLALGVVGVTAVAKLVGKAN